METELCYTVSEKMRRNCQRLRDNSVPFTSHVIRGATAVWYGGRYAEGVRPAAERVVVPPGDGVGRLIEDARAVPGDPANHSSMDARGENGI